MMTPDQMEACAKRGYEIFAANSNEVAPWEATKNKTGWIDGVRDHHNHPDAIARKLEPNLQERCILQAYWEMYAPPAKRPLVIPADEKKGKGK